MDQDKKPPKMDINTETKIKNAARVVFHKKGFAATRTRDIAEEAGINLALLNYYFRSKQKLFDLIMFETMHGFLQSIFEVFNNDTTTLEQKIETMVNRYIDLLLTNPDIPIFLLNELRTHPEELVAKMGMKDILMDTHFLKQFQSAINEEKITTLNPLHFIMNLMGMVIFPFMACPIIKGVSGVTQSEFETLMQERRVLVPKWIHTILHNK